MGCCVGEGAAVEGGIGAGRGQAGTTGKRCTCRSSARTDLTVARVFTPPHTRTPLMWPSCLAGPDTYLNRHTSPHPHAARLRPQIRVIRGGCETQLSIFELLVGDVALVETGDFIPADGVLFEGGPLK